MTSLLCVQRQGGDVEVHDRKMAEALTIGPDDKIYTTAMPRSCLRKNRGGRPQTTPDPVKRQPSMDATGLVNNTMKMQDWLSEKTVMSLQQDVANFLEETDRLNLRKRELLHKTWNDRVYEPIRRQILGKLDCHDWLDVERRRRVLHDQYLEHLNKKGHVFLDTLDKGEYYAQALTNDRPAPIMVYTPELRDPLLVQQRDRNKEEQTILRCTTGNIYSLSDIDQVKLPPLPLVPLGRHGTDSSQWLEMPLGNIESTPRKASRLRMKGNGTTSQMDFEQWAKIPFDPRIVDHEMQTQKKRMFEEKPPYGIPPRQVPKAPFGGYDNDHQHQLCQC